MWKGIASGVILTLAGGLAVWYLTRPDVGPSVPPAASEPADPGLVLSCNKLLLGASTDACRLDISGPGRLTIEIKPNPRRTSWELALDGLATVAQSCEFRGDFDQHNPRAIQGRGQASLICPVAATVDRGYHELAFTTGQDIGSLSIGIAVRFEN